MDNDKKLQILGKKLRRSSAIILGVIVALLLAGTLFLFETYHEPKHRDLLGSLYSGDLRRHPMKTDEIEPWMTFGFLNKAFDLSPSYLQMSLDITDKKYPNITIRSWAARSGANTEELLLEVKMLIDRYKKPSNGLNGTQST